RCASPPARSESPLAPTPDPLAWQSGLQLRDLTLQRFYALDERWGSRCRDIDVFRLDARLDRSAEKMRVAGLASPWLTGQLDDERPVFARRERMERRFHFTGVANFRHACTATAELAGRLRPS